MIKAKNYIDDYWPYARSIGYPGIHEDQNWPIGELALDYRTQWASYPLENNVYCPNSTRINSTDIVTSGGNSGGPLYFKNPTIQNGILVKPTFVLGVMSGGYWNNTNTIHTSIFCRLRPTIVNIIQEILYDQLTEVIIQE